MKLTAETITDEQIWGLYNVGAIDAYALMMARCAQPGWRADYRARCAEILNARSAQ